MKISIILPVYNSFKTIQKTIDSVVNQSYKDWELIIIDDASTDETISIVEQFLKNYSNIHYYALDVNSGGPAKPRNVGLRLSKYEWIAFIDSDDVWRFDKLEIQVDFLKRNPNVNFVSSLKTFFSEDLHLKLSPPKIEATTISFTDLTKKNRINNSSVLIKKELLSDFNEDLSFIAVEDALMWLKITEKGAKCVRINQPLYYYKLSGDSISANKLVMLRKRLRILKDIYSSRTFFLKYTSIAMDILFYFILSIYEVFLFRFKSTFSVNPGKL
jgi:teichuronic acid biosynthesis glycosyltransferase TuaG